MIPNFSLSGSFLVGITPLVQAHLSWERTACSDRVALDDILCEQFERVVGKDNCVQFENLMLQIPPDRHRHHYMKVKVKVLGHTDGTLSIKHGPRRLARYDTLGQVLTNELPIAM